ncbi:MAG: YdbH domain-containing protein, partial [Chlamydiales bacterium]|nr:YdbH domain-containing protein [Chlamydiales bacterium]
KKIFPLKGVKRRFALLLVLLATLLTICLNISKILTKGTQMVLSYTLSDKGIENIKIQNMTPSWQTLDIKNISFLIPSEDISVTIDKTALTFSSYFSLLGGNITTLIIEGPKIHVADTPLMINSEQIHQVLQFIFKEVNHLKNAEIRWGKLFYHDFLPLDLAVRRINPHELEIILSHSELSQISARLTKEKQGAFKLSCKSPYFKQKNNLVNFSLRDLSLSIMETGQSPTTPEVPLNALAITGQATLDTMKLTPTGSSSTINLKKPLIFNIDISHHWENPTKNLYSLSISPTFPQKTDPLFNIEGMSTTKDNSFFLSVVSQKIPLSQWIDFQGALSKIIPELIIQGTDIQLTASGRIPLSQEFHSFTLANFILEKGLLKITDLNLHYNNYFLKNGQTTLELDPTHLSKTKNNQLLTFQELSLDSFRLEKGELRYALSFSPPTNILPTFSSLQFSAFGGSFHLDNFKLSDPKNLKKGITFSAAFDHINLAPLVKLADIPSLRVEGKLIGHGLFIADQDGITILDMMASSLPGGGILQYHAPASVKSPESKLFLEALQDFRYTHLTMTLKPTNLLKKKSQGIIKILGSSPKVLNGYPFEININTTGRLQDLISNGLNNFS